MKQASWTNRFTKPLAALLGVVALLTLAACGGGGTGATQPQTNTGSLSISPSTAVVDAVVPVTFIVSGGVKPYTVTSDHPTLVPVPGTLGEDGRFTVTATSVPTTATTVTITVRDGAQATTTAILTINGRQVLPLSVSPIAAQVAANVPVTFTITGGTMPYTVVSSQPTLVPNPTSIDAQGRFVLMATTTPSTTTQVIVTIRDAGQNVVTVTMTILSAAPVALSVLPQTATVYYNTPAVLTVIGGTPPYQAFSTNSVVLPVARNVVGDQILLAPSNVDVDTIVTITVVDSAGVSVTATITVKPAPLLNTLTITPTPASPGVGCGSAVCAGQTASVTVLVRNLAGAGIQGRSVRFENVQGNYQFLTNGPGLPETLANSITVTTGQDGLAVVRLKADVNAPTQVALIRATELTSGNVLNSSFVIAQFTDGAGTLTAIPTTWTVTGPNSSSCAANTPVTYYIFGGTPPYRIQSTLPDFANIVPTLVQTNGGGFTAVLTGLVCSPAPGASITITDATGRTIAVQLINSFGTGNPPTNFHAIQIVPGDISTPLACGQSLTEQIVGGDILLADGTITQPTFVVSTVTPGITATLSGRTIVITRTTGTTTSPATIFVSNGFSLVSFTVAIEPVCGGGPQPATLSFAPSPLAIACASTSTGVSVITGGTGPFTSTPGSGLTTTITGNILTVTRSALVVAGSQSIPVFVTNAAGTAIGTLMVAPTASCP